MPTRGNSSRLPASQGLAYDVTHLDRAIFFPSPPPHTRILLTFPLPWSMSPILGERDLINIEFSIISINNRRLVGEGASGNFNFRIN